MKRHYILSLHKPQTLFQVFNQKLTDFSMIILVGAEMLNVDLLQSLKTLVNLCEFFVLFWSCSQS